MLIRFLEGEDKSISCKNISIEIDTGAEASIIKQTEFNEHYIVLLINQL